MRASVKLFLLLLVVSFIAACGPPTSDDIQQAQQETILAEGTAQIGMPAITHFQERKNLKMILELRDQGNLATYTYVWNEFNGRLVFFCNSIGYGIPYATQYTNPAKIAWSHGSQSQVLPQADPNGLFSPSSAEGTWVMCADPAKSGNTTPVYVEPRIIVSQFKLTQ